MYILLCSNGNFYVGSARDLNQRILKHKNGNGSNYTRKHLPVKLIYYEEFDRIDDAFYREKQIQTWGHEKKKALVEGKIEVLKRMGKKKFE